MLYVKSGDTKVVFSATLNDDAGVYDLTGCTVRFLLSRKSAVSVTPFSDDATIEDENGGVVSYTVGGNFPTAPGVYRLEWEVTDSSGDVLTFPNDSYELLTILEDLN